LTAVTAPPPPPGWYADPAGGGGFRWWDGQRWTDHVQQAAPPPPAAPPPATPPSPPVPGGAPPHDAPSLYEQPVLVVSQKRKPTQLSDEYAVLDGAGRQIGAVVRVGRSRVTKAMRRLPDVEPFLTHRFEVRDTRGPVLVLTRPARLVRSRVVVQRPDGALIGEVAQVRVLGGTRFDLVADGRRVGAIRAESRRAGDFAITDAAGTEVARITKKWEGLARTLFTTADHCVVLVHVRLVEPLASLVLAAALTVDTVLKQDDGGPN
jgi:hypothetical protein